MTDGAQGPSPLPSPRVRGEGERSWSLRLTLLAVWGIGLVIWAAYIFGIAALVLWYLTSSGDRPGT